MLNKIKPIIYFFFCFFLSLVTTDMAIADDKTQTAPQKDMIISSEAITQLSNELGEVPLKYSLPILQTLKKGLKPINVEEEDKKDLAK